MVHILGTLLPNNLVVRYALTKFYGVGNHLSSRIMARFQIFERAKIRDLTPQQITSLTAFLSSPTTAPIMPDLPLARPEYEAPRSSLPMPTPIRRDQADLSKVKDPLKDLIIENELRKKIREDIAHHRNIGNYRGRRHALGLPVRGQNTQTNANTARKLNRVDRRG